MVFERSSTPNILAQKSISQPSGAVNSFGGQIWHEGANALNYQPGQFLYLKNMEYGSSGSGRYVATRRGTKFIGDLGAGIQTVGSNLWHKADVNYFLFVDTSGTLRYSDINGAILPIKTDIHIGSYNDSFFFGLPGFETSYFCNTNDGIYKATQSGGVFVYALVNSSPATSICFSNISGRMFSAYGHNVAYSKVQNQTAIDTSNLEDFEVDAYITINPSQGKEILATRDNGQITFFWKDVGIWALINASEDPTNWIVPQCNADQGTLSPKSIDYGRYGGQEGFIYLASDKTLRFFNGQVIQNAGVKPTLVGGDSKIISRPFQTLLDSIPDGFLHRCAGRFFLRYYLLSFVSATGGDLDTVIVIDTDKLYEMEGADIPQPFWFFGGSELAFTESLILNSRFCYSFNINGYLNQLFTEGNFWDEAPIRYIPSDRAYETYNGVNRMAIPWAGYLAWMKVSDYETMLTDAYVNAEIGGMWPVNFVVNSFILGESIPFFTDGLTKVVYPYSNAGGFYNLSIYGGDYYNQTSQVSLNGFTEARGHFFLFGFYASGGINEWAKIFSIEPRFNMIKATPMGANN